MYRLSYFDLCLLIIPLVSFAHCIVCPTLIYAFWLPLWYLLAIASSVLLWLMPSDYPFGILWPLYRLSYFDSCLLITPLVSFGHCVVCSTLIWAFWLPLWYLLAIGLSVLLRYTDFDYPFGIFKLFLSEWVSEWVILFNVKWAIFQLYHCENKLHVMRWCRTYYVWPMPYRNCYEGIRGS